jgi:hypothetical protein
VLRDIVDAHLKAPPATVHGDPFRGVIGIGEGDGTAVAENYENYLYGEKPETCFRGYGCILRAGRPARSCSPRWIPMACKKASTAN